MTVAYEEITKFVKNIYFAQDRKLNEEFLPIWIREILITGADITILKQAEAEIIRSDIKLRIKDVCDIINKYKRATIVPISNGKCKYCGGKGYVYSNLYFDKTGKLLSRNYALACACNTKSDITQMQPNDDHNKTLTPNGYFRCFATALEQDKYLQQVLKNKGRDIK